MKNRILKKKLLFLHHIATLEEDSIAFQVYSVQKRLELPGLLQECLEFLVKFGIIDVNKYSSGQWKKLVEKNITQKNKTDLLETVKGKYKKISYEELSKEQFELKPYIRQLNMSLARDKFRLRSKMTRTVKFNFPSDKKFKADMWRCWHCPSIDSQAHVRVCPAYHELRHDKDLNNDKDLVLYFRQVIKLRDDMTSDE